MPLSVLFLQDKGPPDAAWRARIGRGGGGIRETGIHFMITDGGPALEAPARSGFPRSLTRCGTYRGCRGAAGAAPARSRSAALNWLSASGPRPEALSARPRL